MKDLQACDLLYVAGKHFQSARSQALYLARGMLVQARVSRDSWTLATTLKTGLQVWEREVLFRYVCVYVDRERIDVFESANLATALLS